MKPQEAHQPEERAEVRKFRDEYAEALSKARVSEEHTATEGWQDLYGAQRETTRKGLLDISGRLQSLAEISRVRTLTEDEEKALGEIKKDAAGLRQAEDFFRAQVVEPVMAPLHDCNRVIENARAMARNAENETPLHTRGLVEAMEAAIEAEPKPKFAIASGRLIIS